MTTVSLRTKALFAPSMVSLLVAALAIFAWLTLPVGSHPAGEEYSSLSEAISDLIAKPLVLIVGACGYFGVMRNLYAHTTPRLSLLIVGVPWVLGVKAMLAYETPKPSPADPDPASLGTFLPVVHLLLAATLLWAVLRARKADQQALLADTPAPAPATDPSAPQATAQKTGTGEQGPTPTTPADPTPAGTTHAKSTSRRELRESLLYNPTILLLGFIVFLGALYGFFTADVPFEADPVIVAFLALLWTIPVTVLFAIGYGIYRLRTRSAATADRDTHINPATLAAPTPLHRFAARFMRHKWINVPAATFTLAFLTIYTMRGGNIFATMLNTGLGVARVIGIVIIGAAVLFAARYALKALGWFASRGYDTVDSHTGEKTFFGGSPDLSCRELKEEMVMAIHRGDHEYRVGYHDMLLRRGGIDHCAVCRDYFIRKH